MSEFATQWAHVTPWLRPVWMSGWDFVYAIGALLLVLGWGGAELVLARHRVVGTVRNAMGR
jgi:hypothetical protein